MQQEGTQNSPLRRNLKSPNGNWSSRAQTLSRIQVPRMSRQDVAPSSAPATKDHSKRMNIVQRFSQSVNLPGISRFGKLVAGDGRQAIPHISVPNINYIDWAALQRAGFQGCVFDKDNTLTEPYALQVAPLLAGSLRSCIESFKGRAVLLSNSAGLEQFDPDGMEADKMEARLGIYVLRHKDKKPAGGVEELEAYFKCPASRLVMVGDRCLTDTVFGNRNGMLTIRPAPLTLVGEPSTVLLARRIEDGFVHKRVSKGLRAPDHPLIQDPEQLKEFVKEPVMS